MFTKLTRTEKTKTVYRLVIFYLILLMGLLLYLEIEYITTAPTRFQFRVSFGATLIMEIALTLLISKLIDSYKRLGNPHHQKKRIFVKLTSLMYGENFVKIFDVTILACSLISFAGLIYIGHYTPQVNIWIRMIVSIALGAVIGRAIGAITIEAWRRKIDKKLQNDWESRIKDNWEKLK